MSGLAILTAFTFSAAAGVSLIAYYFDAGSTFFLGLWASVLIGYALNVARIGVRR